MKIIEGGEETCSLNQMNVNSSWPDKQNLRWSVLAFMHFSPPFFLMNGWAWSGILVETILQEQKCRLLENCMKEDLCYNTKRMANLTLVLLKWVLIQMSLHGAWLTLYKCEWRVYISNKSVTREACSLICPHCCYTLLLENEATVHCECMWWLTVAARFHLTKEGFDALSVRAAGQDVCFICVLLVRSHHWSTSAKSWQHVQAAPVVIIW